MIREAHSPEMSTCCWAHTGPAASRITTGRTEDRCDLMTHLSRRTRRRRPARTVRFLLEVSRRHKRNVEVHGIVHDRHDGEPLITVRFGEPVEVFRHRCAVAVRNAVLPQVPRAQLCRHDLQRSRPRANAWTQSEAQAAWIWWPGPPF